METEICTNSDELINIVVEGCCHGELDNIYSSISILEKKQNLKVHLLICCGDFQSLRNTDDFNSLAVPMKYKNMQDFHRYYSGEKVAPVLTIFIGGNHEASNALQELFYGGWVAPNIYYIGRAGCLKFGGLKIAGLSGIFKERHYKLGHYERPPYTPDSVRSVYHVREIEVFKLAQIQENIDIFLSHDWPANIARYGNKTELFRKKDFLQQEVEDGSLGSPPGEYLLKHLGPSYWFAAHLHVKYAALFAHPKSNSTEVASTGQRKVTKFLSLDKCLPHRDFLQLISLKRKDNLSTEPFLSFDPEWLAITKKTHGFISTSTSRVSVPSETDFVSAAEIQWAFERAKSQLCDKNSQLKIPANFIQTVPSHGENTNLVRSDGKMLGNPQTDSFLACLELSHKVTIPYSSRDSAVDSEIKYHVTTNLNESFFGNISNDTSTLESKVAGRKSDSSENSDEEESEAEQNVCFVIDRGGHGNSFAQEKTMAKTSSQELEDSEQESDEEPSLGFVIDRGGNTQSENLILGNSSIEDPSAINIDDF